MTGTACDLDTSMGGEGLYSCGTRNQYALKSGAFHSSLRFGILHEGVPDEACARVFAITMVIPLSMPITSLSYQFVSGLKASTNP